MKSNKKNIRKVLKTIWVIWGICFTLLMIFSVQSKGVDKTLLQSSDSVEVMQDSEKIEFIPFKDLEDSALIFYPGGLVDPKAYVPMARNIAEEGYRVIIIKLPLRMAFSDSQKQNLYSKSKNYIEGYDEINQWILAGHSRGGALAAEFIKNEMGIIDSLILIGTTHPKEFSLSDSKVDITKIYASNDGLASESEIVEYSKNLPDDTNWIRIEGGNHSQFGYYSFQLGDNRPTISREKQQDILVDSIIQVMEGSISK